MEADHSGIDQLPLFQGLKRDAREIVAGQGTLRNFAAGQALWTAGTAPRGLFVVLEGKVRVVRAPGGRQYTVHTEGPGGTLGEVPLFAGGRYLATALAAEPTVCLALGRDALARAIAADPELAFRLLARLSERVRTVVSRLDRRTSETVPVRLATLLLGRHSDAGGTPFTLGATQAEVAEELGTVREVLVRALRTLRAAGRVEAVGRARFRIPDPAALRDWIRAQRPGDPGR